MTNNNFGFIGYVQTIQFQPSHLEGIQQNEYVVEIMKEDGTLLYETVPVSIKETEDVMLPGSFLTQYVDEIKRVCLEAEYLVLHKEILNLLKDKTFRWKQKKMGPDYIDIPAKLYWIPTPA